MDQGHDTTSPFECEHELDSLCVGVAKPTLCDATFCTDNATCTKTIYVKQGSGADSGDGDGSVDRPFSSLSDAAAQARDGDCIAVAAGNYAPASIGGGVSILGAGARTVTVNSNVPGDYGLRIEHGAGGLLRGIAITGAGRGILLDQASDLVLENLRFTKTTGVALHVRNTKNLVARHVHFTDTLADDEGKFGIGMLLVESPKAAVSATLVEKSDSTGLLAIASALDLRSSMLLDNGHFGIGLDCGTACDDAHSSTIEAVEVARSAGVGIFGRGIQLAIKDSDVGHTRLSNGSARNIELLGDAQITLTGNTIHHSEGQGLLIDAASGTISSNKIVNNTERGLWMQSVSSALALEDNEVLDNAFVGIGATACEAVTITGGRIDNTRDKTVLVGSTTYTIGDGLQILSGSKIAVSSTTLSNNARVGVLVDGSLATVGETVISGGLDLLVVQNAKISDQTLSNNKDKTGKLIDAVLPTNKYYISDSPLFVGVLPIPLP